MAVLLTFPTNRNDATEVEWSALQSAKFRNGVYKSLAGFGDLEVFADQTGMQVKVRSGMCIMGGFDAQSTSLLTFPLEASDPNNPRIDRLVARLNRSDPATISIELLKGTPATNPAVPTLTSNATITEMPLAQVRVNSKAGTIIASNVTDERVYAAPRGHASGMPGLIGNIVGNPGVSPFTAAIDHSHPIDVQALLRALIPAGAIWPYVGASSVPSGWLPCDGRVISRVEFAQLFSAQGTLYGGGDGSTTFNTPDFRDRFLSGPGSRGVISSSNGNDQLVKRHSHSVAGGDYGLRVAVSASPSSLYLSASGPQPVTLTALEPEGPVDYKNSLPRYAVVQWIVKAH